MRNSCGGSAIEQRLCQVLLSQLFDQGIGRILRQRVRAANGSRTKNSVRHMWQARIREIVSAQLWDNINAIHVQEE